MRETASNIFSEPLSIDDFNFDLPGDLIAQFPLQNRSGSKLLHVNNFTISHLRFSDIVNLIDPNDLLIVNDTKVMKARLFGNKLSGAQIEMLIERIIDHQTVLCHIRANRSPKAGTQLLFENQLPATVIDRQDDLFCVRFDNIDNLDDAISTYGHLPLPPYIQRDATANDDSRYQTVFAKHPGAVAAPTAGLHFDEKTLVALKQKGVRQTSVTLHVGSGTFLPIRDSIENHKMHTERFHVSQQTIDLIHQTRQQGGRIIACGTTTLRALESASDSNGNIRAGDYETDIFIRPGYQFKTVDRLITNFHLPKTTLLMLVSAFSGIQTIKAAYQAAIEQQYRFFSYGDAMLLEKMREV